MNKVILILVAIIIAIVGCGKTNENELSQETSPVSTIQQTVKEPEELPEDQPQDLILINHLSEEEILEYISNMTYYRPYDYAFYKRDGKMCTYPFADHFSAKISDVSILNVEDEYEGYDKIDIIKKITIVARIENEFYKLLGTHEIFISLFMKNGEVVNDVLEIADTSNLVIEPTIPFKKDFLFETVRSIEYIPKDFSNHMKSEIIPFSKESVEYFEFFEDGTILDNPYIDDFNIQSKMRVKLIDGRTAVTHSNVLISYAPAEGQNDSEQWKSNMKDMSFYPEDYYQEDSDDQGADELNPH